MSNKEFARSLPLRTVVAGCVLAAVVFHSPLLCAQNISPPSVQQVDEFGVNLVNGQVTQSLGTVSIGGATGISHAISMYSNHFFPLRNYGYMDKFYALARYSQIATPANQIQSVMRVYDFTGSADFRCYVNGVIYNAAGPGPTSNYTYVSLRDERDRLQVAGANREYLDWIKPDGTVTRFLRIANAALAQEGRLVQVTYPNGFTINIDILNAVTTNTGFAIAYQYESDTRPVPVCPSPTPGVPPADVGNWSQRNPRYVKAVNAAVCNPISASCLTRTWPTAMFTWPAGMPRTMYCGESVFEVQTPAGTTTFRYKPYDLAYSGSTVVQGYTPGARISPRLYKVKPANSTIESIEYAYKNLFQVYNVGVRDDLIYTQTRPGTFPTSMGSFEFLIQDSGAVTTARVNDRTNTYEFGSMYMGEGSAQNLGSLAGGVWRVIHNVASVPAILSEVDTRTAQVTYESTLRNFPYYVMNNNGVVENYTYTRGNVSELRASGLVTMRAIYPAAAACDTSPKTCNQPTSVFDANNNETKYEYHDASGQVSRIIPPADQNGKQAETRFDYQQLRARYYDTVGNLIDGSPIYMRVAERHCHDSNYAGAGPTAACLGGDEVVTRYEYNNNNLLLTSTATTDSVTGRTLRTCFSYDVFGDKIGETQPKGATTCH